MPYDLPAVVPNGVILWVAAEQIGNLLQRLSRIVMLGHLGSGQQPPVSISLEPTTFSDTQRSSDLYSSIFRCSCWRSSGVFSTGLKRRIPCFPIRQCRVGEGRCQRHLHWPLSRVLKRRRIGKARRTIAPVIGGSPDSFVPGSVDVQLRLLTLQYMQVLMEALHTPFSCRLLPTLGAQLVFAPEPW